MGNFPLPHLSPASDATSGVNYTDLWCKGLSGTWANTGQSQPYDGGTFYYTPTQGDGTYYFATLSTDYAGNLEEQFPPDGDTSTDYTAPAGPGSWPNGHSGKEGGGGGYFIATAASA